MQIKYSIPKQFPVRIYEQDDESNMPILKGQNDLTITPTNTSVEDTIKALEDKNNYGKYQTSIRNVPSNRAEILHFGTKQGFNQNKTLTSTAKKTNSKEEFIKTVKLTPVARKEKFTDEELGEMYDILKSSGNITIGDTTFKKVENEFYPKVSPKLTTDFLSQYAGKPNILKYDIKGDTLVFPQSKNESRDYMLKILKTVLENAGIEYKIGKYTTINEGKIKSSQLKQLIKEEIIKMLK
jgi:hypothetical protein